MKTSEIRIAGFGGQGVVLAGMVIGNAATLHDGKFVTLTQSFGPEARGTTCSVQLIVSDEPILYPYLTTPDILVVMSQDANETLRKRFETRRPAALRTGPDSARAAQPRNTHVRHSRHTFRGRVGAQTGTEYGDGGLRHRHDRSGFAGSVRKAISSPCPAEPNP